MRELWQLTFTRSTQFQMFRILQNLCIIRASAGENQFRRRFSFYKKMYDLSTKQIIHCEKRHHKYIRQ